MGKDQAFLQIEPRFRCSLCGTWNGSQTGMESHLGWKSWKAAGMELKIALYTSFFSFVFFLKRKMEEKQDPDNCQKTLWYWGSDLEPGMTYFPILNEQLFGTLESPKSQRRWYSDIVGKLLMEDVSRTIVNSYRWWFQIFFVFTPIWGRFPIWLIFFKGAETTNQTGTWSHCLRRGFPASQLVQDLFEVGSRCFPDTTWAFVWTKVFWVVKLQIFFIFIPEIEEDEPILTSIFFQLGWFSHQPDDGFTLKGFKDFFKNSFHSRHQWQIAWGWQSRPYKKPWSFM